ncbi:PucR family transcriptional regulator [Actinomadura sp. LOL_016]|uniref:PucR family transcriptional regulator n=1 Tax=unclassified Actinomadura TaxID=2626254 RepID=UPI003A805AA3
MPHPMTTPADSSERRTASVEIENIVRAELPAIIDELIDEMRAHVPKAECLFRPDAELRSRQDIEVLLHRCVDRVVANAPILDDNIEILSEYTREAYLRGSDLNTLLAISQIGARVVWKHFASAGTRAGFTTDEISVLAERIFAYLELVSAQAVDSFEHLYQGAAATLAENRKRLLGMLLSELGFSAQAFADLAREANWRIPESVACVAVDDVFASGLRLSPALDADVLMDLERPDPHLLVPMAGATMRYERLRRGLGGITYTVGPVVPLEEAALSLRLARRSLALVLQGRLPAAEGHLHCDEHLPSLAMVSDEECLRVLTRRALAPLSEISADRRTRLSETLLTWLSIGSTLPEVARRLSIHPQTVRYRMRQLEEIFGERLYDPDWRFEMQLALRFHELERHNER